MHQMRHSPNDSTVQGPNPIRAIRFLAGLSLEAFADRLGLKPAELSGIESGRTTHLREELRAGFERAGYAFDELREKYASWRDAREGGGIDPAREPESDEEARIMGALKSGVRGIRNIASASGVPYASVQHYLRHGKV